MKEKKMLLSFKGNKVELHNQFKKLCKKNGQSMTTTILSLIEEYSKKYEKRISI